MHISGNTILITGGGSGIGLALVRELYYEGNNIILTGRNEKTLRSVKKEFPNISTFQCDIFNPEDIDNLLDTCRKAYKTINIFIANAGIQRMYAQQQNNLKTRKFQDAENLKITSPIRLIYGLIPLISKNKNPAIVLVSHGQKISEENSPEAYRETERSVKNFSCWLRNQLINLHIEVFSIIPPLSDAQLHNGLLDSGISEEAIAKKFVLDAVKGRYESNIGKSLIFKFVNFISPTIAKFLWRARE